MTSSPSPNLKASRPLPSFLAVLVEQKASGLLVASSDAARREIVVVAGEVRAARSTLEDEKLGMWLVDRGRISEDDRALTLLSQGGSDAPPLGHLLVTRGCLDQEGLEAELQELALTIIRRAAQGARTYCEFMQGRDAGQLDTLPNLTTAQIILEAARCFPDVKAKAEAIGGFDQTAAPAQGLDTLLQELVLTPTEAFLLSRVGSDQTIGKLLKLSSLPEEQAIATLYDMVVSGVIRIGETEAPARPALTLDTGVIAVDESSFDDTELDERAGVRRLAEAVTRVDHYRALGLQPGADADAVREAWTRIEERYGPARAEQDHLVDLAPQMAAIVERAKAAYDVLNSARARERYDSILDSVEKEQASLARGGVRHTTDPKVRNQIVEANLKRADELIHDGELYPAIQLLEQACALDPRPTELLKLAKLLLRNPLWTNRALSCMRRAIEVDPQFVDAWLELAEFWRRRNHAERQRKALERALAVDPENERANQLYRQLVGKKELDRLLRRARESRRR
jgi:tetratricopeptide (TPR) repeat protein